MATENLQNIKHFPQVFTPAGMPSIHGGLAGLGQSEWDWGMGPDIVSPDLWSVPPEVTGAGDVLTTMEAIEAPPSIDQTTQELSSGGWTFSPPGGASAVDPGWRQDPKGLWYWSYADGTKMYTDGTQVDPSGAYTTPDGYYVNPSARTVTDPSGVVTAAASGRSVPDAFSAAGSIGSSLVQFVRGLVNTFTGPQAPAGARPGQIFRAANGTWYRLNADGTTSAVAAPGAGLFGGGSSGLMLVALGVGAFLLFRKRHS